MKSSRLAILALFLLFPLPVAAETVLIEAARDTTLIEHPDGALSNGSGPSFFAGRTAQAQNGVRRALLYFDIAAAVPRRAVIEEVSLTLYMLPSNAEVRELRLYRVLADWGEGASFASGGSGAPAEAGDATWLHTMYDWSFWARTGGHFMGRVSASRDVGDSGFYSWHRSDGLAQDVRLWNAAPHRNFGWILIGDETSRQTVKSFASREDPEVSLRPVLAVTYRLRAGSGGRRPD